MSPDEGIHSLKASGLNIFLSAKVADLPSDLFPFSEKQKKKTLILIGHGGKTLWENIPDLSIPDPVDTFSIKQMHWFADHVLKNEIEILFPHQKYILPLQKLGRFFNLSHQSPLGFDISLEFGLWFAYRGVFLTEENLKTDFKNPHLSPCESCKDLPCLSVSDIIDARMKCPVHPEHRYTLSQQVYHQSQVQAFKERL